MKDDTPSTKGATKASDLIALGKKPEVQAAINTHPHWTPPLGFAMVKREGWAFCPQCEATAPPGEEIPHKQWCTPYEPSRWERFVKRLDALRFWEKGKGW